MIYDISVHVNSKLSIMSGISRNATYLTKTNKQTKTKKSKKTKTKKNTDKQIKPALVAT